jgi:hypothetical protein
MESEEGERNIWMKNKETFSKTFHFQNQSVKDTINIRNINQSNFRLKIITLKQQVE